MAIPIDLWFALAAACGWVYYVVIAAMMSGRRRESVDAMGWLALLLISSVFHTSIVPPRLYPGDLLVAGVALFGSVWMSRHVPDLPSVTVFAFFQSLVLLFIFENFYAGDLRIGWHCGTTVSGLAWSMACPVAGYTSMATLLGWLRRTSQPRVSPSPDHHPLCAKCGCDLFGLTASRCPECGAPFESRP